GFSRDNGHAGFNAAPQAGAAATGANPFAQGTAANPYATNPYAQQGTQPGAPAPARTDAMTIDDVVTRTAMTLGTVIVAAAIAWWVLPVDQANLGTAYGVAIGAAIIGFVLSLVNSFKRRPSPPLILTYAAFEGVFLGIVSNIVSVYVAPGAAMQAVLGTMAVFAGVLIAYRTGLIRVTRRFYGFVMAAAIGFMLLMMVNLLFAVFGGGDGL
ncbi:Bax inhibitor-1/YccA family protein, partial [Streptomyces sp. SID8455]|nr:Bax inhibitor-1/YccA family protein [Streptomyces sp. SID8455]